MALGLQAGQLELAALTSVAAGVLPSVLRNWQVRHPEIEVSLHEFLHRRGLEDSVRDGEGDMAVGGPPADWQGPVERLGWEEFVLVLPEGDELLRRRSIDIAELADRRWVHFVHGHGLAQVLDMRSGAAGFSPRVAVRTSQVAAAPQFAAAGLGPALVPDHIVTESVRHLIRPARPRLVRRVVAFTRSEWSPITRAFLDALRDYPWRPKARAAVDLG
jgi:DNA-binding transcriptional LysR family regulator